MSKEDIINEAEKSYKNKAYDLSLPLFKEIWDKYKINDPYTLFKYGNVLRKNNLGLDYIEIYKNFDFSNTTAIQKNYVDRILSWCLYDLYIKNFDVEKDNYDNFILNAHKILEIQSSNNHDYYESAFVKTCLRVVKEIAKRTVIPNYKEIIWWIELLDVGKLSIEPFRFKDSNSIERELASDKETYYSILSKCYEKINDYPKCHEICEMAIKDKDIVKFHYRNHIWINERKLYCECFINQDYEKAINQYAQFAEKYKRCYMFHKCAALYFSRSDIKNSVLYGSKALLLEHDIPKIINLLEDLAYYWREFGNSNTSKKFFYVCTYYRTKRRWKISQELAYEIKEYGFNFIEKPDYNELVNISKDFINNNSSNKINAGVIVDINYKKKFGFIKQDNDSKDIHFNFKNVIDKKILYKNTRVIYEAIVDNRNMKDAINLRGE